jgi:hypothetical protein
MADAFAPISLLGLPIWCNEGVFLNPVLAILIEAGLQAIERRHAFIKGHSDSRTLAPYFYNVGRPNFFVEQLIR